MSQPPVIAYVLLWFPKASETFIQAEVEDLVALGADLSIHTLYGRLRENVISEVVPADRIHRLGLAGLPALVRGWLHWLVSDPLRAASAARTILLRRWGGAEAFGENLWAFFCGAELARRLSRSGTTMIHAPWARGAATAAWTASHLSGIPFSFSGRAHDIHPGDRALADKIAAAAFIRVNTAANKNYLASLAPGHGSKVVLVYNGLTFPLAGAADPPQPPPWRLLAVGRLTAKKGFDVAVRAVGLLRDRGLDARLTIVGDGRLRGKLTDLVNRLGLADRVRLPGRVGHDRVSELMTESHLLVCPSIVAPSGDRDGVPNVIMEALLHNLPVAASDAAAIGEVIKPGLTGDLARPGRPDDLARVIAGTLADRAGSLARAARGREMVLGMFDRRLNHRKMKDLLSRRY